MIQPMFNRIDPSNLSPHPLNEKVYGDEPDEEFIKSCEGGVLEPLGITKDMVIISGHRRWRSAVKLGLDEVPVLIRYDLTDPLEIEEALILANKHREKTNEMKAREYEEIKRIEEERARQRKAAHQIGEGGKLKAKAQGSSEKKGRARDLAAAEVGWSSTTAEAAVKVVEEIEEAEQEGNAEEAEELREMLNTKGVWAAHRHKRNRDAKPPGPEDLVRELRKPFRNLIHQIGMLKTKFAEMKDHQGGDFITEVMIQDFNTRAESLQAVVQHVQPTLCKVCDGYSHDCQTCGGKGYVREY